MCCYVHYADRCLQIVLFRKKWRAKIYIEHILKGAKMKKLLTLLFTLLMMLALVGCQKKQIVVSLNFRDGDSSSGMRGELNEKSTLKDLFDSFAQGADFSYELDSEGYIVSINGKANDEFGYWEILLNNDVINDVISKIELKQDDVCDITYIPNQENPIVGGWQIAPVSRIELTEEEEQIFNKATEVLLGETYEPVCVLATQVVSGTNYAYLALGTTVTANPVSNYCVLKVYQDLQGNVKVESISEINILDIETREDVDDNILGGWTVRDSGKAGSLGSEEAQSSFEKAMSEVIGVGYNPIQLLASQLVNGTNYIALARGRVAGADDTPELYVIRWYADLQGNSTVNEIKKFDLNYYVD